MSESALTTAPLDDRYLRRIVRHAAAVGIAGILVGFIGMLTWAASAPLVGSIVAPGFIKVDTNRKTVQHRDGGIVREILVREGEQVRKEQPLVVLEDARIDSSHDLVRAQLDAELIRRARLLAERQLAESFTPPQEVAERSAEARVTEMLQREQGIFATRRRMLDSQLAITRKQIEEVSAEIAARQGQDRSARHASKLMADELAANESLLKQNFISRARFLMLQRNLAEYDMRLNENLAELAKARQKKSELELKLVGLRETYVQEASAEVRDTANRIVDFEEKLRAARDASERKVISAPVAGRVVDLRVTTAGSPIGPRDPVLDIVPMDVPLIVEARVPVDAISELHTGLHADVRLTAYKQRTTPLVDGKVSYVSADALNERQGGAPYYLMHIEITQEALRPADRLALYPGMAAEVYVKTRERTAVDYLLEPMTIAIRRAFRDY